MRFDSENQLYRTAIKAAGKLALHPNFRDSTEGDILHTEKQLNGQRLFLVAEPHHYSRKPVDHVHSLLVPRIQENPGDWLILRKNGSSVVRFPIQAPVQFYFQELAGLLRMPYEEALADLHSHDTQEYIRKNGEVDQKDIDRFILTVTLNIHLAPSKNIDYPPRIVGKMSKVLQKPPEYAREIFSMGSLTDTDIEKCIVDQWNDYSRKRFHELRRKYSDRSNILVSVGYSHLPVFE